MDQLLPSWTRRWIAGSEKPLNRGEYELVSTTSGALRSSPENGREPTDLERKTLRKVADHLPWYVKTTTLPGIPLTLSILRSTFLIAIVELCERFTYYGLSGPFQNYISNSYHDPNGLPGVRILEWKSSYLC